MKTALQFFNNKEFGQVRIIEIEGKPYFVASDVAKALGYAKPNNAINEHCRSTLKQGIATMQGNISEMLVIPEGDIYRLVVRSKLPTAEKFEKWVFDEVLPSIRKNGGYINNQENMTNEQLLANAVLVAQNVIAEKDKQITEMKPKALFADAVSASNTSILIGELAKILKQTNVDIGQNRLFEWLRNNGYLIRRKGTDFNAPTQKSMELGLFEVKETCITHSDGHTSVSKTTKVSGRGQQLSLIHI